MMRRQGATGDDWSDWEAHLPASPGSSGMPETTPEALSSITLSQSLSKQTSDKFEAGEGKHPLSCTCTLSPYTDSQQSKLGGASCQPDCLCHNPYAATFKSLQWMLHLGLCSSRRMTSTCKPHSAQQPRQSAQGGPGGLVDQSRHALGFMSGI